VLFENQAIVMRDEGRIECNSKYQRIGYDSLVLEQKVNVTHDDWLQALLKIEEYRGMHALIVSSYLCLFPLIEQIV
jgi:hypothetical protein